jgi:predicted DNA binding CopG/RHH family protein
MKSDRAVKAALKSDLSAYILPENFKSTTFEFARKDKNITLRVSSELLVAVQSEARRRRTNYQKLIREAIERFLTKAA